MKETSELSPRHEARLYISALDDWRNGPMVLSSGCIMICRRGRASFCVNYKEWEMYEGAVITFFPGDVVDLDAAADFEVEVLEYSASLLREASLQLERTVYSTLREDRCRQDAPVVTRIIDSMFTLLRVYFEQNDCMCIAQLVLCQLKAFFIGFHEYLQRYPEHRSDEVKSYRVRELFNLFMMLLERDYKKSRDVNHYAGQMNITPKYLTHIVRHVSGRTPKNIIDQYVILQIKMQLRSTSLSVKELAWDFHFPDVSFFCRYFKRLAGVSPLSIREQG